MESRWFSLDNVRLDAELHLPSYARVQLQEVALRTIHRFGLHFGDMRMHVHLKHEGSQVGCKINLVTDHGHYAAQTTDWNPQGAVLSALGAVELQLHRHVEKHTHELMH